MSIHPWFYPLDVGAAGGVVVRDVLRLRLLLSKVSFIFSYRTFIKFRVVKNLNQTISDHLVHLHRDVIALATQIVIHVDRGKS
jgi:hypothetical protein